MDITLTVYLIAAIAYAVLTVSVVALSRRTDPSTNPISREALGDRRFGPWTIAILMAVTMIGPADALALSENGKMYGYIWAVFPIGAALAQYVSGRFFVPRIKANFGEALTVGDIFETQSGKSAKIAVGVLTAVQAAAFSGVLILAGGQILEAFFGLERSLGMIGTATFVACYSAFGGMNAVISTDRVQAAFMATVLTFVTSAVVMSFFKFDPAQIISSATTPEFFAAYDWTIALTFFLTYFLGELLLPAYTVRGLLSDSDITARKGFERAALLLAIWYVLITLGGAITGLAGFASLDGFESFVIVDLVSSLFDTDGSLWIVVSALLLVGFLAISHSTFDSFLHVGSVGLSRDVVSAIFAKSEKAQVLVSKFSVFLIAGIGCAVALWKNDLIDILFLGYTIWVPTLLVPTIWIALRPNNHLPPVHLWAAVVAGIAVWAVAEYGINTFVPSILAGAVANHLVLWSMHRYRAKKSISGEG